MASRLEVEDHPFAGGVFRGRVGPTGGKPSDDRPRRDCRSCARSIDRRTDFYQIADGR